MDEKSKKLVAGAFSSAALVAVSYPLDTIKVRLQILGNKKSSPYFTNSWDCVAKTVKQEGIRGIYRGMGITILGTAPIFALGFLELDVGSRVARILAGKKSRDQLTPPWIVAASLMSGSVTATIMTPTERIKCLLQVQTCKKNTKFYGPLHCATQLGIRQLYRGFCITYLRGISMAAVFLSTNKHFKKLLTPENKELSSKRAMFAGGMTGMLVWAAVLPIDAIKTKVQTDINGSTFPRKSRDVIKSVIKYDIVKSLYKGFFPVVFRALLGNITLFSSFNLAMAVFQKFDEHKITA